MNNGRPGLVLLLLLTCAAPGSAVAKPRIVSAAPDAPAQLDQALELRVTAREGSGVRVSFPDLRGVFAQSACRVEPGRAAAPQTTEFAVPYRPAWTGLHLLEVAVTDGGCSGREQASRRSVPVEVSDGAGGVDSVSAPRGCRGADLLPLRSRIRALRLAVVCLVNRERAAAGLAPLHTTAMLRRTASGHAHDMRRRAYFGHGNLAAAGVQAENLAAAPGRLATPRSVVSAWLASDPLRANVLDPAFRSIGVGVIAALTVPPHRAGATYVVELSH